ncbi:unnamed protein product [Mytilus coruscus]|uniref:Ig-like domain-containing protein n=1 Tax=Mytilus coruscus TaxID=42192 RepID=A0A6J8CE00_MYTCO|nr:unnamed protein product [Mytilus coruscus]
MNEQQRRSFMVILMTYMRYKSLTACPPPLFNADDDMYFLILLQNFRQYLISRRRPPILYNFSIRSRILDNADGDEFIVICDNDKNICYIHSGFLGHDNDANAYHRIGPIGPGDALDFPPQCYILADSIYPNGYPLVTPFKSVEIIRQTRAEKRFRRKFNIYTETVEYMWNRKKFIFVFLKVLQTAGIIQEILVKTDDTVVLNCTCTNQTNGLWDGPNKSASRINGLDEEYLMPYAQGTLLNSKLNLSKYYIVGSYKNKTCNLMIKKFSSNDEGKYHCNYVENDTTISRFYRVLIQNPPDVLINTTHFEDRVYLECHASGDSGPYTFKDWEHKSESGKHIRYIHDIDMIYFFSLDPPDVLINTTHFEDRVYLECHASGDSGPYTFKDWEHKSESGKHIRYIHDIENKQDGKLVLQKDNYQNSGIYICRVNNGIPYMNGKLYKNKQVLVHYEGPPVIILNIRKTWFAQSLGEVNVILKVFTSSDITSDQILKLEELNNETQSSEVIDSLMHSTCRDHLVFYNVNVKVPCIELTFNFTKSMEDDSRNYSAKVCNKFGCGFFDFTVISTDDDFKSTFPHGDCWIIMGSLVGGILIFCVCSHIYCCLKRAKTCSSNNLQITQEDNYDEVDTLNYNNVIFDHIANDADNDNVSSIIESNDIVLRDDVVSSDDSSSIKQSGDGYENPYQAINPCDIDMHHYSSIFSCSYQNTIIFPPCLSTNSLKYLNTCNR